MRFTDTNIPDVKIIEPEIHGDNRGYFMESFRQEWFDKPGLDAVFVQDNQSLSLQGTLRGLHYQLGKVQGKYLRVLKGEIYDVAVDLRKSSPTFAQWVGLLLSEENKKGIWVPPGFAHGFYVTSESAEILYKCTDYYAPGDERCLLWNDKEIGIAWPVVDNNILLSEKDKAGLPLSQCDLYP